MTQYKIGDRVERLNNNWTGRIKKGYKGTVVGFAEKWDETYVDVQWDEYDEKSVITHQSNIKKIDGKGITYKPNCIQLPAKRRKYNV